MELTHKANKVPIKVGAYYKLLHYGTSDLGYRRQLYAHGILPGTIVKLIRIAPLGCPLEFILDGVTLTLRRAEWQTLVWELA